MQLQHFFVEGKYLGKALRQQVVESTAFYCPLCGEVWARFPIEGEIPCCVKWRFFARTCRTCGYTRLGRWPDVPGSVSDIYTDPGIFAAFPDAVLQWELVRHLEWFDRDCPEKVSFV